MRKKAIAMIWNVSIYFFLLRDLVDEDNAQKEITEVE
jgi:hypothetical protein